MLQKREQAPKCGSNVEEKEKNLVIEIEIRKIFMIRIMKSRMQRRMRETRYDQKVFSQKS
jgi:hypothetical protein